MGNLENVKMACEGFELPLETKENVLIIFKKLLDEVPCDAFFDVSMSKVSSGFDGHLHISSIAGDFIAHESETTPQALVEKMVKSLRTQLISWKSKRFLTGLSTEITA